MHDPHNERMSGSETRAAGGLALVFAFRMLGMFMVLPVLATYGMELQGSTPALIGLAIGAYGLTQALLQIPFGMLSDRIGRRPVIYVGLLIFAAGSLLAANADSIYGVIAGRILQGAGAISAAVMALLSDLTREQHRTKAMAMVGMSIGLSFAVAMVVGPLLTRAFGLSGLFLATAAMALLGIVIVAGMVPGSAGPLQHRESGVAKQALLPTLKHADLLRLDFGILVLHAILMASFIALPLALVEQGGLAKEEHWWVYLTALLVGFFGMLPFIIYGEKKRRMKQVLLGAVTVLLLCELFFWWFGSSLRALVLGTVVFFTAFNLLEASLPSLISKVAPAGARVRRWACIPPVSFSARPSAAFSAVGCTSTTACRESSRAVPCWLFFGWPLLLLCANRRMSPACACRFQLRPCKKSGWPSVYRQCPEWRMP